MRLCVSIRQADGGHYIACCPALPGCFGSGQTRTDAVDNLVEAATGYLAAVGNFVPESLDTHLVEV